MAYNIEGRETPLIVETNTTDASMEQYVPQLSRSLEARFGEQTPHFLSRLSVVEPVPFQKSNLHGMDAIHEMEEMFETLEAMDSACAAWQRSIRNLKGIVSLDPPSTLQ